MHDAFYGKRSGEDCRGKLPYKDEAPTCSALDAKSNVQSSCDGKQTCLLFSDENIYGKSLCPHVNKYLNLKYSCSLLSADKNSNNSTLNNTKLHEDIDQDPVTRSNTPTSKHFLRTFSFLNIDVGCKLICTKSIISDQKKTSIVS